jgi:hypothetical protein
MGPLSVPAQLNWLVVYAVLAGTIFLLVVVLSLIGSWALARV